MGTSGTRRAPGLSMLRWEDVEVAVESGAQKKTVAPLEDGPLLIGTAENCGLRLEDKTVSAHHCELRRSGDAILIRDLGSTNGVVVDGVRVTEAFPEVGARIRVGQTQLRLKRQQSRELPLTRTSTFGSLYGETAVMRAIFAQLETIARTNSPLLIEGETGTGKDLTAEAVHQKSERADGPFVPFDCGAVAANLLEAELFGYEKGAFTGANASREGIAASADGGTLVLDEIGELPLELQPKLLRLVERREIRPVGANSSRPVDVRIVACTHRSLKSLVKEGKFREDLFYRLTAFRVRLPALRERPEDLPGLVDRLLAGQGTPRRFADLPEGTQAMLRHHDWPGNIRELRNVVERLVAFENAPGALIEGETGTHSRALPQELIPLAQARERAQTRFEFDYLKRLMEQAEGSISEGARKAGVSRQFLQRLLRKHGLR